MNGPYPYLVWNGIKYFFLPIYEDKSELCKCHCQKAHGNVGHYHVLGCEISGFLSFKNWKINTLPSKNIQTDERTLFCSRKKPTHFGQKIYKLSKTKFSCFWQNERRQKPNISHLENQNYWADGWWHWSKKWTKCINCHRNCPEDHYLKNQGF